MTVLISFIAKIKVESLKKDMDRLVTIPIWDYMTHQQVNVFDLRDNSMKKWVQKIHMGTFTYSDGLQRFI